MFSFYLACVAGGFSRYRMKGKISIEQKRKRASEVAKWIAAIPLVPPLLTNFSLTTRWRNLQLHHVRLILGNWTTAPAKIIHSTRCPDWTWSMPSTKASYTPLVIVMAKLNKCKQYDEWTTLKVQTNTRNRYCSRCQAWPSQDYIWLAEKVAEIFLSQSQPDSGGSMSVASTPLPLR